MSLGLARANVGLGKLVSAQEIYIRLVHDQLAPNSPSVFVDAVENARKELAALTPRIPSIILQVSGAPSPKVTLDDGEVPAAALAIRCRPIPASTWRGPRRQGSFRRKSRSLSRR